MYLVISEDSAFMYTLQAILKDTILLRHTDDTSVSAIMQEVGQMEKAKSTDTEVHGPSTVPNRASPEEALRTSDPHPKISLINSPGTIAADAEYNWKKVAMHRLSARLSFRGEKPHSRTVGLIFT